MKFSIKDFFSKSDQIRSFLRIRPHLVKKPLMENFIFCAVVDQTFKAKLNYFCFKKCMAYFVMNVLILKLLCGFALETRNQRKNSKSKTF